MGIEHRLCPPRHPQTKGMLGHSNGRISQVIKQTRFATAAQLKVTLMNYVKVCNHQTPQRALQHFSPVQALKNWFARSPSCSKWVISRRALKARDVLQNTLLWFTEVSAGSVTKGFLCAPQESRRAAFTRISTASALTRRIATIPDFTPHDAKGATLLC